MAMEWYLEYFQDLWVRSFVGQQFVRSFASIFIVQEGFKGMLYHIVLMFALGVGFLFPF